MLFQLLTTSLVSAAVYQVNMEGLAFNPAAVTIKVGDAVNWNFNSLTHSVVEVANDKDCTGKGGFGSPDSVAPAKFSQTFSKVGTFFYVCDVGSHCQKGMRGVVNVVAQDGKAAATTTKSSVTQPTSLSNATNPMSPTMSMNTTVIATGTAAAGDQKSAGERSAFAYLALSIFAASIL